VGGTMSVRNIAFVVSAVVGLTVSVAGQRPLASGSKASSKVQAKTVVITGCVAQGIDGDHYVLSNAVRREQPPSSVSKAGTSQTVGSDKAGATDRTGPYDLQGGEFKAHLGHTVEVTGTSGSTVEVAVAVADAPTSGPVTQKKPLPRFNVLSVKMVSATCS
jgi:hypothetical protein